MKIQSLQIGQVKNYTHFKSGFIKDIYLNSAKVEISGIVDDGIADLKHHGGKDKAIFANSCQNYILWENFLNKKLNFGTMGENLSIDNLHESNVCIGDIHKIGDTILQVSEPRKPCVKISLVHDNKNFTREIFKSGLSGWYYKVLQKGTINLGDGIKILQKDSANLSVLELNKLFYQPKENLTIFNKLLACKNINKNWIESIEKRLNQTYDDEYMRKL
ncbi:MOSC domain-containing protein [Campylobacter sp. US33a]|uniref:MOSC domain-containing protein n=1 Tax=Campylobacter sp. CCS1377 TaxID=3158229 RepID=A0AAU7E6H6_9BACT|nr:MOSC domain-containing protein [Campylobacter sp. US33a]MCW1360322.1 MOSC domain-containing protein [Campylobacter jejuni]TEY01571.1 MOSC domain-containing protein [Campylobacter sp. US33a]